MKITLQAPYKSILSLNTENLPGFAVLIGRNGSGKTQLLSALAEGAARIGEIDVGGIEHYDMLSFHPPGVNVADRNANQFGRAVADQYFTAPSGAAAPFDIATEIFDCAAEKFERTNGSQGRTEFEAALRAKIGKLPDYTVFLPEAGSAECYEADLYERVMKPLDKPRSDNRRRAQGKRRDTGFDGNPAVLIGTAMRLSGKLPHELMRGDIVNAAYFEGATLSNTISEVFSAYKLDQFIWAHKRIEKEAGVSFQELMGEYRSNHPPPWDALRDVLARMREEAGEDGLFDFEFSDPENHAIDIGNFEQFGFRAEMTNRTTGAQYDLSSLSSGEKILMAMCLIAFNQYLGRRRPKLLLLDEVDAVLHPSMVAALVTALKSLFVAHGTMVFMTSHCPITVASLEESDVFRLSRRQGHVEVKRTTRAEATRELSEGIATVDTGLRIAAHDNAAVTILSEGNNALHLKRWAEIFFPRDVYVFDELQAHTSTAQLLAYGRLLAKMNTNTHFVIVWDCDGAKAAEDLCKELPKGSKVTAFALKMREQNSIVKSGIENNYDEEILEPFTIKKSDNDGRFLSRELPKSKKGAFAKHILSNATRKDFAHFTMLQDVVSRIVEKRSLAR
ncbi:MAG: ATP-binding protein [Chloroflexi bacterium]|nr:ATP-binding protein [Chloroflexota bacterium]